MKNLTTKSLLIIVLVLSFLLFQECNNKACAFGDPTDLITNAEADALEENYKNKYQNLPEIIASNNGVMPQDVRDIWFDLETLQNYLNFVKEESDNLEYENPGIRVYFGAKKTDGKLKNTVFFTPTNRETTRQGDDENNNSYKIKSLNYGNAGMPPKEFEGGN